MNKILLAALALSFAATSAMAAPRHHMNSAPIAPQAGVVVQDGTVIGQDPDGYVRFELLRTAAAPNQG
jgi:hypothetical protein